MTQRFETFVLSINRIYRCIQKIKSQEMTELGLKGTHVMCLFELRQHPEGLTAAELSGLCLEDKAAVSRALAELERRALVTREAVNDTAYRALVKLTEEGRAAARYVCDKVRSAVEIAGRGMNEQERVTFYANLRRIAENLRAISDTGLPEPDMT